MPHGSRTNNKYKTAPGYTKPDALKDKGITERTYKDAEQMAKHPEILESVIENAQKRMGEITQKIDKAKGNQYAFSGTKKKQAILKEKGIGQNAAYKLNSSQNTRRY